MLYFLGQCLSLESCVRRLVPEVRVIMRDAFMKESKIKEEEIGKIIQNED